MSGVVPVSVKFLGATLQGAIKDGACFVAMRPVVEGMGLDWASQYTKMTKDEVLGPTVVEITMVAEDGKRRAMTCIPEEYLQGWMFTVKPGKVKAILRAKIVRYKRECYRVLHQAFVAESAAAPAVRAEYLAGYHQLHDIIKEKASASSKPWAPHMNANKAINKAVGVDAGQRGLLPVGALSAISVANQIAAAAYSRALDHHDGHQSMTVALGAYHALLNGGQSSEAPKRIGAGRRTPMRGTA
ncbi:phage antirepressor N-terminal domain-containing protein [Xenophilus sp.]|uniref:phage antirepressor N-terminal domain-containing protein n=1 Tax=Xenophilus sp. TaxID=1873499 RepID=UPI0037DC60AA